MAEVRKTMMAATIMLLGLNLTSCVSEADQEAQTVYDHSCDVSTHGWTSQDTLFYPVLITEMPELRTPIKYGRQCDLWCNIRTEADFPYTNIPMTLIVQQTDTTGSGNGTSHVIRNLLRHDLTLTVCNEDGRHLGDSWGSLVQLETKLDGLTVCFDTTGTYRMLLIPNLHNKVSLPGITSIGLTLRQKE